MARLFLQFQAWQINGQRRARHKNKKIKIEIQLKEERAGGNTLFSGRPHAKIITLVACSLRTRREGREYYDCFTVRGTVKRGNDEFTAKEAKRFACFRILLF